MTEPDLRAAINASLSAVPFTDLDVAYCAAVKAELARRVPSATLDVYFVPSRFSVEARVGAVRSRVELNLRPPGT